MLCDLERVYGELAGRLPEDEGSAPVHLDEDVIPLAPPEITTDRVRIYRSQLQRLPGYRGDHLDIVAPRSTIRQLGLLVLAALFHDQCNRSILNLAHPDSALKHIVTEYRHWSKSDVSGFRFRPWVFGSSAMFPKTLVPHSAPIRLALAHHYFVSRICQTANMMRVSGEIETFFTGWEDQQQPLK